MEYLLQVKILQDNNIKLDWLLGVIGIKNGLLSKVELLSNIVSHDQQQEDLYVKLFLEEESLDKEDFIKLIISKLKFSENQLELGEKVWLLMFLNKLENHP